MSFGKLVRQQYSIRKYRSPKSNGHPLHTAGSGIQFIDKIPAERRKYALFTEENEYLKQRYVIAFILWLSGLANLPWQRDGIRGRNRHKAHKRPFIGAVADEYCSKYEIKRSSFFAGLKDRMGSKQMENLPAMVQNGLSSVRDEILAQPELNPTNIARTLNDLILEVKESELAPDKKLNAIKNVYTQVVRPLIDSSQGGTGGHAVPRGIFFEKEIQEGGKRTRVRVYQSSDDDRSGVITPDSNEIIYEDMLEGVLNGAEHGPDE